MVLRLRQALIGDRIRSDVVCPAAGCGQRIDIDFSIEDFVAHHAPQGIGPKNRGRAPKPAEEPGWFCLARPGESSGSQAAAPSGAAVPEQVCFRLPTAADLVAVAGRPAAEDELARRCLRPAKCAARLRRRRKPRWRRWPRASRAI